MNALVGKIKVLPVNEYIVWYSPVEFPTVSTDAVLIDGDGELLVISTGCETKIIHVDQMNRIVTHHVAQGEEIAAEERQEYDDFWADR